MIPRAVFRAPDGILHSLHHGSLIGRIGTADLVLDDVRISEAHAMVSIRGGQLHLLSLRGRFAVAGKPVSSLVLQEGQQIWFARDLALEVVALSLPEHVMALESDAFPRLILSQTVAVMGGPTPRALSGYRPDADALFWNRDDQWHVQLQDEAARPVGPGDRVDVQGLEVQVVRVGLERAGGAATHLSGGISGQLRIVAAWDSVQIHQDGQLAVVLSGVLARLFSELAIIGGPVEWETLATEVWGTDERYRLRRKLDQSILRLRRKLEASLVRNDLVHSDGKGLLELLLQEGDLVEDRT